MMGKDYAIVVKPRIEISSIDITDDGKYGFLVTPDLFLLGFKYDENGKPKKGTVRNYGLVVRLLQTDNEKKTIEVCRRYDERLSDIDEEICNIIRDRMSMGFPNDKRKNSA